MNRNQQLIVFLIIIIFVVLAWIYGGSIFSNISLSQQNGQQTALFSSKVDSVHFSTSIFNDPFFVRVEQSGTSIPTVNPGVQRNANPFLTGQGTTPSIAATSAATSPSIITLPAVSSPSTAPSSKSLSVLSSSSNQ